MMKMTWYFDNDNQLALRWDVEAVVLTTEQEECVRALLESAYPEEEISADSRLQVMSPRKVAQYRNGPPLGEHHCFARSGTVRRRIA